MLRCLSLASSFSSFLTFSSNTHTHTHPHTPSLKFSTQPNYNSTKICISFQKHRFSHFWVLFFLPSLFPLPIFSLFLSLSLCHNNNTLKGSKASLSISQIHSLDQKHQVRSFISISIWFQIWFLFLSLSSFLFFFFFFFFCFHFFYHI